VWVELLSLSIALVAILSIFVPTVLTGSSPVPTSRAVRSDLIQLLPERLPERSRAQVIYELGSGWGGMAFALAKKYPEHSVIGYEISILPWLISQLRQLMSDQQNLQFRLANFNNHPLSDAALIMCYLLPVPMERLRHKLSEELTTGTLVVSNTFAFRGWSSLDDRIADDIYKSHVYLYEIGSTSE